VEQSAIPAEFVEYVPPALAEVNVPAYVVDVDGRVCWINDAGRAIVGDVVGKPFTSVIAVDTDEVRQIFENNLAGKHRDVAVDVRREDGTVVRCDVSSARLGSGHHVVGMFGIVVPEEPSSRRPPVGSPLTRRQHEVLDQLAEGASTSVIAERLYLSPETVRNHVRNILQRLNTNSRLEAVAAARREGLV
jgi:PAS domain S-box-containing protein